VKRVFILLTSLLSLSASARPTFDPSQLEFIDNGTIKLGEDQTYPARQVNVR